MEPRKEIGKYRDYVGASWDPANVRWRSYYGLRAGQFGPQVLVSAFGDSAWINIPQRDIRPNDADVSVPVDERARSR